jgi:hypothetical protein
MLSAMTSRTGSLCFRYRCLLVPAAVSLTGRWNGWAPKPLRGLHARYGLRESESTVEPEMLATVSGT